VVGVDGISNPQFPGLPKGPYFLVIRHRNHLAVMSSQPVVLNPNSVLYDFTTGQSQYHGGEAALLGSGVYGMFGGDANSSGVIDRADQDVINASTLNLMGFHPADINLSAVVTNADRILISKNNYKTSRVP
jgi:hypothetical protein